MINFLAEISQLDDGYEVTPIPSIRWPETPNIFELDIRRHNPSDSYWVTDWGGYFNTFTGEDISLFYGGVWLSRIIGENAVDNMLGQPYSYIVLDGIVYMNLGRYPWLYADHEAEFRRIVRFVSSALNPDNPSNTILNNEESYIRLEVPSFNMKLSDSFAGVNLHQGFSINLINNDGFFDDEIEWNIFNTPIYLKKTNKINPEHGDFIEIRRGFVENNQTNFNNFQISVSDRIGNMQEPVCEAIPNENNFRGVTGILEDARGKNIPVVFGTQIVKLERLNTLSFLAADFINATGTITVMDRNGGTIAGSTYTVNRANGIITFNNETSANNADTARITGYTNNRIGNIIEWLTTNRANIPFNETYWNIPEFNRYANTSPLVNITFDGGTVRNAINDLLKSDMAYFMQLHNGRLTVRSYNIAISNAPYGIPHNIPPEMLTQPPTKTYANAQNNYFSSCIIRFNPRGDGLHSSIETGPREIDALTLYGKTLRREFDTNLATITPALNFAISLANRYSILKQTIRVAVGMDTSQWNLLDRINIDLTINGRKFSNATRFIIKEINPAQDILVLEEY